MKLAIFNIGHTLVHSEEPQAILLGRQLELYLPALVPFILEDQDMLKKLESSFAR
jgi:hypothetical protein